MQKVTIKSVKNMQKYDSILKKSSKSYHFFEKVVNFSQKLDTFQNGNSQAKGEIMNRFEYINDEYDEEFCHILDNETEEEYNDLEIITDLLNNFEKELEEIITNLLNNFEKELEVYNKALDIMAHDLAILEWEGLGRFARSEEIIKAEVLDAAKDLMGEKK